MLTSEFERVEAAELSILTRSQLESFLEQVSALESFLAARRLDAMGAIDGLNDGGLSSETVLRSKGKVDQRTAKKAAETADTMKRMPKTAARLRNGEITEAHAKANADAAAATDNPAKADEELNRGRVVPPADLHTKHAKKWVSKNERRERAEQRRARQHRNRKALFGRSDEDGSWTLYATTDTTAGKDLKGLIEAEADRLYRTEDGGRAGDSDRTNAQRTFDALVNLIRRGAGIDTTDRPTIPHPRFQPVIRLTIGDYLDDVDGELIGEGPLPRSVVERVLCESGLDVLLTADDGSPLWLGRSSRDVTPRQWTALIERDEGCVICGAEPSRCEAHHIVWWRNDGPTDIDNLVLLCVRHHHDLHDRGLELTRREGVWLLEPKPVHERQPAGPERVRRRSSSSQARAA